MGETKLTAVSITMKENTLEQLNYISKSLGEYNRSALIRSAINHYYQHIEEANFNKGQKRI